jgi:polyhydroxybutyrate depolymerase
MKKFLQLLVPCFLLAQAYGQSAGFTLNYQNTVRDFLVHLPTGYTNGQQLPLVINMHGYTSNAQQQEAYTQMDGTADNNQFIVCYPNGLSNAWNSGFVAPYNSSPDDVGFISKIIDTLHTLYGINLNRVYACGMSNGGFQSHRLACDLENRIAAIASVTGVITDLTALNCVLSRKVPVMQVHGTLDPVVSYAGAAGYKSVEETVNFWLGKDDCPAVSDTFQFPNTSTTDGSTVERIRYTNCDQQTEVLFYKITGGGHTWPGGAIDLPSNGNTNRDFNASQEIWDFFNRYTLQGPNGIEPVTESGISVTVYPNPSTASINVNINGSSNNQTIQLLLTDLQGRLLISQPYGITGGNTINMETMAPGIYFLKIAGKGITMVKQVVKQ